MLKAIHHVGIVVKNLEESLCFYRDILGLKSSDTFYDETEDADILFLEVGNETVELISPRNVKVSNPSRTWKRREIGGVEHIAFTVDSLEEMHDRLSKNRVTCLLAPTIFRDITFAYYEAPDGVILELVEEIQKNTLSHSLSKTP